MDLARENELSQDQKVYREMLRHFAGNWVWRATEALIDHPEFEASAIWVKSRLGISIEEAVDALDGLEKLGILRRNHEGSERRAIQFLVPQDLNTRSVKIQNSVHHSQQILNRLAENEQGVGLTFYSLLSKDQINEAYERFEKILAEMHGSSGRGQDSRLFGLSFTASVMEGNLNRGEQ